MGVGEPALWSYLRIKTRIEKHPMIQYKVIVRFDFLWITKKLYE